MKKTVLSSVLAASVLLVSSCSKELTSQEHLARASDFMAAGDYASAQVELKNAALKDPQSATARVELARLALLSGDWSAAEKESRRAIDFGVSGEVYLQLATALYMLEAHAQLIEDTEVALDMSNSAQLADIRGYRALSQLRLRQYRDAEAEILAALELAPESAIALLAKSSYEQQVGSRDQALEIAQALVASNPDLDLAWRHLGELLQVQGDLEGGREAYTQAVDARPYVTLALGQRAFIAARLDDMDAARADLKRLAGSVYRDHPDVTFTSGYVAFLEGDYERAALLFEQSLTNGGVDPVAMIYLASALVNSGKLEQARRISNQLYQLIPSSVDVNRLMASIDMQLQDFDAARERIAGMAEQGEADEVTLGMLGSMALMEGDGDSAVGYFEKLVALSPDNADARKLLQRAMSMRGDFVSQMSAMAAQDIKSEEYGQAIISAASAYEQGRVKEALTIAENLRAQFADEVGPLKLLAAIHLASGDIATGKAYFEQVLVLQPGEPTATKGLAQIYLANGEEQRALGMMDAYMKNNPGDEQGAGIQANAIMLTLDYSEAEQRLNALLAGVNENVQARAYLARLYFDHDKYEQVLFVTENLPRESILVQPTLMELRGKSLIAIGQAVEAGKLWQRWLEVSPDSVMANYYHGAFLMGAGELAQAKAYLDKSVALNPDYLPARLAVIRRHAMAGELDSGFEEMARLQSQLREPRGDVWYVEGWLYVQARKYAEAEAPLAKAVELGAGPEAYLVLSVTLNTLGRNDEGLAMLEQGLKTFPNNETLLNLLGRTYLDLGDTEQAVTMYKRLLALRPGSFVAMNNLAWALQDTDLKQAVEYAKLALEAAPEDPTVLDTVRVLRDKGGQF